jgi:hypothetical protein
MISTETSYGWIIWLIVLPYVLAFIVWFLVGYFYGGELIDKAKSTVRKVVSAPVQKEIIKFLKSPNQMKKGN